jgi:putative hemolysin
MTWVGDVTIVLVCFLLSAFFSGTETGSYMINRIRLRYRAQTRLPSAMALEKVLRDPHIFVFTVLIGNNITNQQLTRVVTNLLIDGGVPVQGGPLVFGFLPWNAEMASTLVLMFPLFILAELGPKNLMRRRADIWMYRSAGLLQFFINLFYPLTRPLRALFQLLTRGAISDAGHELQRLSSDALKECIAAEGVLSGHQNRMVENATSMHDVSVRVLMTPFRKVASLPATATVSDFRALNRCCEEDEVILVERQRAVGLIALDTIISRGLGDEVCLRDYAEDLLFLSENRNLKSAFYRLRRNPRHCAVILDARAHPVGLIRLESLARYIVSK